MSAKCWGCAVGVAPVGVAQSALPLNPLGSCWDCGVFGCTGHGKRDRGSGKWVCYLSVAQAVGAGAGLVDDDEALAQRLVIRSADELRRRFRDLTIVTSEQRKHYLQGPARQALEEMLDEEAPHADVELAAHAVGIAVYLLPDVQARHFHGDEAAQAEAQDAADTVGGTLGMLASRLRHV